MARRAAATDSTKWSACYRKCRFTPHTPHFRYYPQLWSRDMEEFPLRLQQSLPWLDFVKWAIKRPWLHLPNQRLKDTRVPDQLTCEGRGLTWITVLPSAPVPRSEEGRGFEPRMSQRDRLPTMAWINPPTRQICRQRYRIRNEPSTVGVNVHQIVNRKSLVYGTVQITT